MKVKFDLLKVHVGWSTVCSFIPVKETSSKIEKEKPLLVVLYMQNHGQM